MNRLLRGIGLIMVTALASGPPALAAEPAVEKVALRIPSQPVGDALNEFAKQSGLQVVLYSEVAEGLQSPALEGAYTSREALAKLLAGTSLQFEFLNDHTIAVREPTQGSNADTNAPTAQAEPRMLDGGNGAAAAGPMPLARADQDNQSSQNSDASSQSEKDQSETSSKGGSDSDEKLEQVIVTGTSIRGERPVGSQAIQVGRDEIERNGYTTAQDIVRSLPQNFNGGFSEDNTTLEGNSSLGSSVNLRGLGSNSTLVLVNGRRVAASGVSSDVTDVSGIPVTAIERVEVLPDGASAIYGSDAVGGVVNYVLRRDYDGAETTFRAGTTTQGGGEEFVFAQMLGHNFGDLNALLSYEHYERSEIAASERSYTSSSDLTALGGDNFNRQGGNPGNIMVGADIWGIPAGQDGTSLQPGDLAAGAPNFFNANEGRFAIPSVERDSAFARLQYSPTDALELFADVLYGHRESETHTRVNSFFLTVLDSNPFYVNPTGGTDPITVEYSFIDDLGPQITDVTVDSLTAAAGFVWDFAPTWSLRFHSGYSNEDLDQNSTGDGVVDFAALDVALADSDPATAFNPFGDGSNTSPATLALIAGQQQFVSESTLLETTAVADGALLNLPAGALRVALGADYREAEFAATVNGVPFAATVRNVTSVFLEARVPLVSPQFEIPLIYSLDFSAAGRYDDYSDFGSVSVPRLGVDWHVTEAFSLRASWGQSYRAPSPSDLNIANSFSFLVSLPDSTAPGGSTNALFLGGTSGSLQEETADTYSVGLDLADVSDGRWRLGLTYFNTRYSNRIFEPQFDFGVLDNPASTAVITRSPTPEELAVACASVGQDFTGGCTTSGVDAIVDFRFRNAAEVAIEGLDLGGTLQLETALGDLSLSGSVTHFLDYTRQLTSLSPAISTLNTPGNVTDTRARFEAILDTGRVSWRSALNFVGDYDDTTSTPNRGIDALLTVDAGVAYRADDYRLSFNVVNLFDTDPPFYNNPNGVGYDRANADPFGRVVSVSLTRTW